MRNEILFKDGFEDKIDIEDYLAPGIDEGYDSDEDGEGAGDDIGIASAASSEEEEQIVEKTTKPVKKLITSSGGNSTKDNSVQDPFSIKSKGSVFADFDKSKKKSGQLKIVFQNPLESKIIDDDNPLGKRVFNIKYNTKHRFEEEDRPEDNDEDFFENKSNESQNEDEDLEDIPKGDKGKLKFKERMKEKKKQAKLEKEKKRTDQKELREQRLGIKERSTQDLELIAGEEVTEKEFRPNYSDPRFKNAFDDHDMAIDTTSNMYKKDKHTGMLIEKKKRRADTGDS